MGNSCCIAAQFSMTGVLVHPFIPRNCLETTVRKKSTVNTVAADAATTSLSGRAISLTPACTRIRLRTNTPMQSSTAAQSVAIETTKRTRKMEAAGQMAEARQAVACREGEVRALRGAVSALTEGQQLLDSQ